MPGLNEAIGPGSPSRTHTHSVYCAGNKDYNSNTRASIYCLTSTKQLVGVANMTTLYCTHADLTLLGYGHAQGTSPLHPLPLSTNSHHTQPSNRQENKTRPAPYLWSSPTHFQALPPQVAKSVPFQSTYKHP